MIYMNKKNKKTLYLPSWVCDLLDAEGEKYDGPGVVAAAAISAFCNQGVKEKISAIQDYRSAEIKKAYSLSIVHDSLQDAQAKKRQSRGQQSLKKA